MRRSLLLLAFLAVGCQPIVVDDGDDDGWSYRGVHVGDFDWQGEWTETKKRVTAVGWHAARATIARQLQEREGWDEEETEEIRDAEPDGQTMVLRRDRRHGNGLYEFTLDDGTEAHGWFEDDSYLCVLDDSRVHVADTYDGRPFRRTATVHEFYHVFAYRFDFDWEHETEWGARPAKRQWRETVKELGIEQ